MAEEGQADEEDTDFTSCRDLPAVVPPYVHHHDIMSCCFDLPNKLIFTGGVDGAIVGWNFDTHFPRWMMHDWDLTEPRCQSDDFVKDSKSVDALVVFEQKQLLLSMSADQLLRFWDLNDLPSQ